MQWFKGFFWGGMMLAAGESFAASQDLPLDELRSIKESGIAEPYKETETYKYAKGEVFDRWVFNPWVELGTDDLGPKASLRGDAELGFVSSEIRLPTDHLARKQDFYLVSEWDVACGDQLGGGFQDNDSGCVMEVVVRCYGYKEDQWQKTFDESRMVAATSPILVEDILFNREQCADEIYLSLKTHLRVKSVAMQLKGLKVGVRKKVAG